MVRSHHGQLQHIATDIDYPLILRSTDTSLKQQHIWTLPYPSSPHAPEIFHKNYAQELAFSLWLSLYLHENMFVITLSLVIFIQGKHNDRMTWNDAPASLALDLVILLSIIFLFSPYSSSFSYMELVLVPLLLLLRAFCAAWANYALTKQHGKDGSSCNGLNLNGQQRQVKTGRKEPESKPELIYINCLVSWWQKVGCCPKSNSYYLSSEGWLAPCLHWQSKSLDK